MDIITLHEFKVETLIGFYEWEQRMPQLLQLDLAFGLPSHEAGQSDRIRDTIDYAAVAERVRTSLATTHFLLLEKLCEHVADIVRNEFGSPWVRVSATKLGVMRDVKRVGVTIERGTAK